MKEEIRERVEMIKRGEVPDGYKRTKLGIIPSDWKIVQIKECLERVNNPVEVEMEKEYTQIGIRSHGKGIFYKEMVTGKELGNKKVFWIEPDCFILNIVFAWEQAVGRTTKNEIGMIASHRFPMYRPITNNITIDYLVQYFLTAKGKNIMEYASPGGAGRNRTLGQDRFMKSYIICPNYSEQNKIAEIMEEYNELIQRQEKLIEEKQKQKQFLLQSLITGKKRLYGFDSEWKTVRLSDILVERKEYSIKGKEFEHVTLSREGIFPKNIKYDREHLVKNSEKKYKITRLNDICYNPANLKFGVICRNTFGDAIFSPIYITFEVDNNYNIEFISQYFGRWDFINAIRKYEEGTVFERMSVNPKEFLQFEIKIPEIEEQKAIAMILATADNEIKLLKRQLEQFTQEKKAMMQLLLTGIVRVE